MITPNNLIMIINQVMFAGNTSIVVEDREGNKLGNVETVRCDFGIMVLVLT